ncbi:TonB-dependent receptor [Bradyrhizobium sp. U87765 SZCCT0131]|uniref:TonB-dependent receptor n=1 Tax=unclassified Bradyrhizobium TaxID=2631580 RepID=UPI001BADA2DF|nr:MULTISPECIES: TonB-dependent receptor [unclassified Bradyrhizobium]MBR1216585.1 TonB-dependent receptor [Bradyrhizobium sp. U87765 SZCCT0131]MBR1259659.1 TonB-dependent receptor [Bradyrhizobium sp. U87765 SZCCT0134]MBR1305800.1 TonB-dependent receptor [Bradyrhizobium sp. U87765 SZCCT0110]MBR1322167.1 TonB-dependent receptor [Bradyrhizobium sp. U87765 SZCCT0109]MBR1350554.1 TonB-dependent receptor [Bradyrhizobium sp. U87765 SZCCT0048]
MGSVKAPRSLRANIVIGGLAEEPPVGKISAVAGLIAVASIGGAEAQQAPLPPVTVDAPVARPRPASKPNAEQTRARNALRRAARERQQQVAAAPVPYPNAGGLTPPDANPYANAAAPYLATRVASGKFSEPIVNTPKTITVLTKELLEDKNATSLKEIARSTAGVTLGTGEGGNAFGDRFFIRGFDARNDIFVDGIRDPAVSIRENFFTEQVEILRGPASSYAGRGTAGGAINIVTKQAADRNFYNAESSFTTDSGKRLTLDVNQVINPTLSVRAGGLFQDAGVAGRSFTTDDRWGAFVATKWTPTDNVKITGSYVHTDLSSLPDFGVPYRHDAGGNGPVTEFGVPRNTYYGFVNRDFQKAIQDIGTVAGEVKVNDSLTLHSAFRAERSVLNYIGTIPESPKTANPNPLLWTFTANPQSRYQETTTVANQSDATFKFDTGPWKHTTVTGVELSRERVSIDTYTGLSSETVPTDGSVFNGSGSLSGASIFNPGYTYLPFSGAASVSGNPAVVTVDTRSVYAIDTANYRDFVILNGGVRYDDYAITAHNNTVRAVPLDNGIVNYNAGIVVKPLPIASVYAAYATSANPVGAELDGTSTNYGGISLNPAQIAQQIYGPEKNKAIEVGTKWELFDRRLLLTGALFQTEKTNARESGTVNGVANTIVAGAAYRIQGIDLEAAGKITDRWSVFGGYVLMTSRVTASNVAPPATAGYTTNVGLPLANIAHQSFNILTKYKFDDGWELGGQATFRSKIYGGTLLAANQGTELPSYWRFDAFVEKKVTANLTAKIFVNNIFNKLYYDGFYQSATPFVFVAPGRVAGLVLNAKF